MRHDQISSLTAELKTHFGVAAMNREARMSLSGPQWHQYREIDDAFTRERNTLNAAYAHEYQTRVEMAQRRLIDQAGSKNLDFKHRVFGRDAFDADACLRQAEREVRFDHDAQVKALAVREHETKENFLSQCVSKQKMHGVASRAFENAIDPQVTVRNAARQQNKQRVR